jgi:glutamyl-Q tRNA(Asp) synthetase
VSEAASPGVAGAVLRFAPSPNGRLHLGHALSALTGFEMARRLGGRFLVRIEDIDTGRARPEFVAGIFEDLAWLGIAWDEPVLVQSQHFPDYLDAARRLEAAGLLYPCFATRTEIADAARLAETGVDPDGAPLYPGLHKGLSADEQQRRRERGEPFALRIDMVRAMASVRERLNGLPLTFVELDRDGAPQVRFAHPARWGDTVIVRKDVPASYHLAVVVDDARQGVSHVTRGRDLFAATDLHRLLQVLLGLPEPVYHHHPLVADAAGNKLSKSLAATSLASLRAAGVSPDDVRAQLAPWRGQPATG